MTRNMLTGTTILPSTHNQMRARGFGLYFETISKSDCKSRGVDVYNGSDKINSIAITDSSLTVDINIYDNCCYDFLCDVSVDSSGVVNLIYQGYGSYCSCDCCFGLTFHFSILKGSDYEEIKAVMLMEDKSTLKKIQYRK